MLPNAPGLVAKPRPPANRRPSSQFRHTSATHSTTKGHAPMEELQQALGGIDQVQGAQSRDDRHSTSASSLAPRDDVSPAGLDPAAASHQARPIVLDRDLDLDLPAHLTAALERNLHRWPHGRKKSASDCHRAPEELGEHGRGKVASDNSLDRNCIETALAISASAAGNEDSGAPTASVKARASKARSSVHSAFRTPERHPHGSEADPATQNTPDPVSPNPHGGGSRRAVEHPTEGEPCPSEGHDVQQDDGSDSRSLASDTSSLDQEWVGNLGRDELEAMLMQANRIIKERERDLGIAAAIGKALLDKNISLRNRQTGLASRLASSTSIFHLAEGGQTPLASDASTTGPGSQKQPCSPPTTDVNLGEAPQATLNDGMTPVASASEAGKSGTSDYFGHATLTTPFRTTASGTRQTLAPVMAPQSTVAGSPAIARTASSSDGRDAESAKQTPTSASQAAITWVPNEAGLIHSRPPSPSGSVVTTASSRGMDSSFDNRDRGSHRRNRSRSMMSQMQAIEAQRQLSSLSEQNEALLQQLSELQEEAERAKREGSKKLNRLNKEIGGLKSELEAVTQRNSELEQNKAQDGINADQVRNQDTIRKRAWTRGGGVGPISPLLQGTMNLGLQASLTPVRNSYVSPEDLGLEGNAPPAQRWDRRASESGTDSFNDDEEPTGLQTSAVMLERMLGYRPGNSDGEQALVAQLLAKIQELEETNQAMAKAGTEMDGKLGRAMEEGERLKDAYELVESSSVVLEDWDQTDAGREDDPTAVVFGPSSAYGDLSAPTGPMTPSGSQRDLDLLDLSPASLVLSPSPQKRRAPGNRYMIENRKTIRAALRQERWETKGDPEGATGLYGRREEKSGLSRSTTEDPIASYSLDLSQSSSAASSPNPRRLVKKVSGSSIGVGISHRPRIRITPSIEDLGARRKAKEVTIAGQESDPVGPSSSRDWEDLASPTIDRQEFCWSTKDPLRPSDALHWKPKQRPAEPGSRDPRCSGAGRANLPEVLNHAASDPCSRDASPTPADRNRDRLGRAKALTPSGSGGQRSSDTVAAARPPDSPDRPSDIPRSGFSISSLASMSRSSSANDLSALDWNQRRTLGSELGSIFGGDDRRDDLASDLEGGDESGPTVVAVQDSLQPSALDRGRGRGHLMPAAPVSPIRIKSERPTASLGRLVPEEEGEEQEDIECVLSQSNGSQSGTAFCNQPPSPQGDRDVALIATLAAGTDGNWNAEEDIVEKGGLKDPESPRAQQYDLICTAVEHQPVHWADDDDFGRPITESEARRIGLFQPPTLEAVGQDTHNTMRGKSKSSLMQGLAWATGRTSRPSQRDAVDATDQGPQRGTAPQVESEEQEVEGQKLERLLRRRRIEILQSRGYAAHEEDESDGPSMEDEVNARVFAVSPARHRLRAERARASRASYLAHHGQPDRAPAFVGNSRDTDSPADHQRGSSAKGKGKARRQESRYDGDQPSRQTPSSPVGRRHSRTRRTTLSSPTTTPTVGRSSNLPSPTFSGSTSDWVRATSAATALNARVQGSETGEAEASEAGEGSETSSDFELLDLPSEGSGTVPGRFKRQGEPGTDYYPISLRARYHPAMVKQRLKVASNEAFVWITTWVMFTAVMIFAFGVAVRRGPGPVLGTGGSTGTR